MPNTVGKVSADVQILGGVEPKGSQQGAKRVEELNNISQINQEPFQTNEIQQNRVQEFGASRNPFNVSGVGAPSINTGASTKIIVAPEIGKGSIVDSIT